MENAFYFERIRPEGYTIDSRFSRLSSPWQFVTAWLTWFHGFVHPYMVCYIQNKNVMENNYTA